LLQRSFLLDSPPLSPIQRLAAGVLAQLVSDIRHRPTLGRCWLAQRAGHPCGCRSEAPSRHVDAGGLEDWCWLAGLPVSVFLAGAERHFRRPPPVPDMI
jgi:hypothetical protein